jgi:hypothetical protein
VGSTGQVGCHPGVFLTVRERRHAIVPRSIYAKPMPAVHAIFIGCPIRRARFIFLKADNVSPDVAPFSFVRERGPVNGPVYKDSEFFFQPCSLDPDRFS